MNSKIFFLGAIMLLPTFASCQQEKPFPDDAVDKVYEYLPEWQAGYLDIHQISTGRGNAAYLIFPDVIGCRRFRSTFRHTGNYESSA